MKRFIEGLVRRQTTLLPECIDDYVDEHNPVRAIDTFIDMLDLEALGFDRSRANGEVAWTFARLLSGATLRPEWAGVAIAVEQRAAIVHGADGVELLALVSRAREERLIARSEAD
jgi:hypothetical protein